VNQSTDQIGVGIIGTGYIAATCHGPVVTAAAGARLAGVLSRRLDGARDFLTNLEVDAATPYDDLDAFLADPGIGLVVVASPDGLHFPQAEASLRSGRHVLVEKPMALSLAEAQTLVDLAAERGLVLAAGYHLRCHAGHELLRQRILDGALGALRYLRLAWSFPIDEGNWRARSDVARWWSLSATGTHCLDLARWFADDLDDWTRFEPVLNTTRWGGRDESAVIAAQLASGASVDVLASIQFEEYTRLEFFGDRGSAFCDGTLGPEGGGTIVLNGQPLDFTPTNPFATQLDRVLAAINGEAAGPPADGTVGLRAVRDLLLAEPT